METLKELQQAADTTINSAKGVVATILGSSGFAEAVKKVDSNQFAGCVAVMRSILVEYDVTSKRTIFDNAQMTFEEGVAQVFEDTMNKEWWAQTKGTGVVPSETAVKTFDRYIRDIKKYVIAGIDFTNDKLQSRGQFSNELKRMEDAADEARREALKEVGVVSDITDKLNAEEEAKQAPQGQVQATPNMLDKITNPDARAAIELFIETCVSIQGLPEAGPRKDTGDSKIIRAVTNVTEQLEGIKLMDYGKMIAKAANEAA